MTFLRLMTPRRVVKMNPSGVSSGSTCCKKLLSHIIISKGPRTRTEERRKEQAAKEQAANRREQSVHAEAMEVERRKRRREGSSDPAHADKHSKRRLESGSGGEEPQGRAYQHRVEGKVF